MLFLIKPTDILTYCPRCVYRRLIFSIKCLRTLDVLTYLHMCKSIPMSSLAAFFKIVKIGIKRDDVVIVSFVFLLFS